MGGPGVHRSIRFVRHLREFGYVPIVLTINVEDIKKSGATLDESLLDSIPKDIQVHRVSSGIPFVLNAYLGKLKLYRLFWFFFYPFFWERSAMFPRKAFAKAKELIDTHQLDLVYTSSGPFSPLILGKKLKNQLGVKWIADLRDPYTDAYAWSYPSKWHWYYSRVRERSWLKSCDKLVVNTPEVKKLYIKRNLKDPKDIIVITNGF